MNELDGLRMANWIFAIAGSGIMVLILISVYRYLRAKF